MLNSEKVIAFLATANPHKARSFYEDQLGLKLVSEDDFAIVYNVQGTELRIQKIAGIDPPSHTVLGWNVVSIEKSTRTLAASGVTFERFSALDQNEQGIWKSPSGAKIAWFKDPDGNMLSLTEHYQV